MSNATTQPLRLLQPDDPHAVAITAGEVVLTWEQLEHRSLQVANAVIDAGVEPTEVWGVLSHNRAEWAELSIGNARAGTRLVPLNWHLTPVELAAMLDDSGCRLIVVDPAVRELADAAVAQAMVTQETASGLVRAGITIVELGDDYERWIEAAGAEPLSRRPAGSPLLVTGGTTGRSKGVTRADLARDIEQWPAMWAQWGTFVRMPDHGRALITTPLYHALGTAVLFAALGKGIPVVIAPRFDAQGVLSLIEEHRITTTPMVPTQFVRMLKLDDAVRAQYDVSSVEWILHTAAPCPAWAKVAMIEWFGPVIYEMYGSSEGTGPAICDSDEWQRYPGTVGKASARIEYSIVDDDGNDLPPGEVGTIYAWREDGPPEYHGDPEKTASIRLPDGRFTVGDLGWLNDDGYLFLADRRVDLILVAGSNVYPAEIEATLLEHPMVGDAAVFGIPDADWGEQVKAVIEPATGLALDEVDTAAIGAFAAERLAKYKLPASYDVIGQLPREAHGKLKKRKLRDPYWENQSHAP